MPLTSNKISPGCNIPVDHAAWCGNSLLIRINPGNAEFESEPPDTERPNPLGPLIISTKNVQSAMKDKINIIYKINIYSRKLKKILIIFKNTSIAGKRWLKYSLFSQEGCTLL